MRRISVVLAVLALVVVMVGSAVPAMAAQGDNNDWGNQGGNDWNQGGNDWGNTSCSWYWSYWDGWTQWCWSPWWGWYQQ